MLRFGTYLVELSGLPIEFEESRMTLGQLAQRRLVCGKVGGKELETEDLGEPGKI